jgi:hypothetical protein
MTAFDVRFLQDIFGAFDDMANPIMGIMDWDDAAIVEWDNKRLVASCDGPYKKRLVMKSALIHASTDVVVKGARPLFALDTLSGSEKDVRDMAESLRAQGEAMGVPILGGNTNLEGEALASIFIVGELILDDPIRQSGGNKGDILYLFGKPLWGEQEERIKNAKKMFAEWYELIEKVKINAAKDVTKGGLKLTAKEIAEASGCRLELKDELDIHMTRNLDNFLISVDSKNAERLINLSNAVLEVGELK